MYSRGIQRAGGISWSGLNYLSLPSAEKTCTPAAEVWATTRVKRRVVSHFTLFAELIKRGMRRFYVIK